MIAIPSLKVRDLGGSRDAVRSVAPAIAARDLADMGFGRLHIAGPGISAPNDMAAVEDVLRNTDAGVQVAGIGAISDIEQLLHLGAETVVVGDRGIEEPQWLVDVADLYPGSIAVATDVRDRRVVRRGWVRSLPVDILDLVEELNALPLQELIVTIPSLDGAIRFGELSLLEDVAERSRCPVVVSGGVAGIQDLRALEHRGIAAAVIHAGALLDDAGPGRSIAREFGT